MHIFTEFGNQLNDDTLTGDSPSHLEGQVIVQHFAVELGLHEMNMTISMGLMQTKYGN